MFELEDSWEADACDVTKNKNVFDDKMFPVVRTKWCYNNPG